MSRRLSLKLATELKQAEKSLYALLERNATERESMQRQERVAQSRVDWLTEQIVQAQSFEQAPDVTPPRKSQEE
jgi:cob(I)alamin adenosyltransferase